MPNEKLPEINEHDAEELIHYPQDEEQKERRSRLLPGRWTRRVQKSSARAQARRRVAEKTSEDHAYLMLGAVPFWAVGATSLQNGIILCAVLIILMLPCSALHLILRRKLNLAEWVALPLTVLVAAMLAAAACTNDIETILTSGLAQIPHTSRLHAAISDVLAGYEKGVSKEDCFADIHARFNEYTEHGWCHTIPNAMIVAAGLLYGGGDYSKSLCMTVETGFDTDCNAATVGSILGMANGIESIASCWTKPLNGKLHTSIFGMETTTIAERVAQTLQHIQ